MTALQATRVETSLDATKVCSSSANYRNAFHFTSSTDGSASYWCGLINNSASYRDRFVNYKDSPANYMTDLQATETTLPAM
jgi:hypothetical protein